MSAAMRLCAHDHKSNAMKVDAGARENALRSISSNMVPGADRLALQNGAILQNVPLRGGAA